VDWEAPTDLLYLCDWSAFACEADSEAPPEPLPARVRPSPRLQLPPRAERDGVASRLGSAFQAEDQRRRPQPIREVSGERPLGCRLTLGKGGRGGAVWNPLPCPTPVGLSAQHLILRRGRSTSRQQTEGAAG